MKSVWVGLLSLILASVIGFSSSLADELCIPLGNIELSAPQGVEAKRSAVDFPHSAHFSINCQDCHHTWEYGDDDMSCMTSGCHDETKAPKEGDKIAYFKAAYHKACIGCHKSMQAKNKSLEMSKHFVKGQLQKTGPTSCLACHPKN